MTTLDNQRDGAICTVQFLGQVNIGFEDYDFPDLNILNINSEMISNKTCEKMKAINPLGLHRIQHIMYLL